MKRYLSLIIFLFCNLANAIDSYNPASGQLTIPQVAVGVTVYNNVVVTIKSVVSMNSTMALINYDTYIPALNQLWIPSVTDGTTKYSNVIVTVDSVVSVGSVSPQPLQMRGFEFSVFSLSALSEVKNSLTTMRQQTNANTVTVELPLATSSNTSTDFQYLTQGQFLLAQYIWNLTPNYGFDTWLKIIINPPNNASWHLLAPSNPEVWFNNYSSMVNTIGALAEKAGITHLIITNELVTMTTNPAYTKYWANLISSLRNIYKGKIGFNSTGFNNYPSVASFEGNEFLNIPQETLNLLDFLGISCYPYVSVSAANMPNPPAWTVSSVQSGWSNDAYGYNNTKTLNTFINAHPNLPVYFTELNTPVAAKINDKYALFQGTFNEMKTNLSKLNGVNIFNWLGSLSNNISALDTNDIYGPGNYSVFQSNWADIVYQPNGK
jgi:hypothetical protein